MSCFPHPSLRALWPYYRAWLETKSPETECQSLDRPFEPSKGHTLARLPWGPSNLLLDSLSLNGLISHHIGCLLILSLHLHRISYSGFWPRNPGSCPNNWVEKFGEQQWVWRKVKSKCKESKLISLSSPHPHPSSKGLKVLFCNVFSKITLAFKVSRAVETKKTSWDPEREMAQLKGICVAINKLWSHLLFFMQ